LIEYCIEEDGGVQNIDDEFCETSNPEDLPDFANVFFEGISSNTLKEEEMELAEIMFHFINWLYFSSYTPLKACILK